MGVILVTGGLGLIGSTVAHRLSEMGNEVHIVDSLDSRAGGSTGNLAEGWDVNVVVGDIADTSIWKQLPRQLDIIVSFAGLSGHSYSMQNPVDDLKANVLAHAAFLERLVTRVDHPDIIVASTRQVYGVHPTHPRSTARPADVNAVGRLAMENLYEVLLRGSGCQISILRLSNVYGPAMLRARTPQGVLGTWLQAAVKHRPIAVSLPSPVRDVLHVEDLADLMVTMSDRGINSPELVEVMEVGGGSPVTLQDIAQHLVNVSGTPISWIPQDPQADSIRVGDYVSDLSYVQRTYGWRPRRDWRREMSQIVLSGLGDPGWGSS